MVSGRVYTPPVPQTAAAPYLVIGSYGEDEFGHYGGGSSESGFDIRGTARLSSGDAPLLALWEQVHAALSGQVILPDGHEPTIGDIRLVRSYAEPSDPSLYHFAARFEAVTAVAVA